MSNHISETEYAQLTDSEKAGYREQEQCFSPTVGWVNKEEVKKGYIRSMMKTRLVYIPINTENSDSAKIAHTDINPTPDREPEESIKTAEGILSRKDAMLSDFCLPVYDKVSVIQAMQEYRTQTLNAVRRIIEAEMSPAPSDTLIGKVRDNILTEINKLQP